MTRTTGPQNVLIMDAGRYVGPALAARMSRPGHRLVLHAPSLDLLRTLDEQGATYGVVDEIAAPLTGDRSVGTRRGAEALIELAAACHGPINAALIRSPNYVDGSLREATDEDLQAVKANFDISFHCLQALTAHMTASGAGSILMCTSAYATRPDADHGLYAGIRAAENALMRSAALEFAASGIAINAIGTAFMKFPEYHGGWRDEYDALRHETPRDQLGTMVELAEMCAVLLEGRVGHLIGQFISFNGGWA